jgi:2-polyprenyl-6-methoxyphenol hydroxylase-like FAD-dependent oxidoreductase
MANPVLIVGAGPVGLTMAAALAHYGVRCRIVEKLAAPNDKSKALAVWCRTMELLDGLGLAQRFVQTGLKLKGGSMYAHGQRLVHLNLTSDESPYGFPLMIPQNETERLLTEHLAQQGVAVERSVELVAFSESATGIQCTLRHADGRQEITETSWLIGCDGAHSAVRHGLGMEFTGHTEPNDWMLADVYIQGSLARDEVSIYWHDEGVVAFFPIDRQHMRVIADVGPAGNQPLPTDLTLAEVQAKVDEGGPKGLRLSNPVWLSYFRINERKVRDYRQGRVMLAGDAAHIHSPAGGQGMNTGMQDAFNLAWKLALIEKGQGRPEVLLQSYSTERSAVGDQVLKNAERFTTMATLKSPVAQWLRNHIVPILGSFDAVQDRIRDEWFEFSVNYRHSPLSGESWPMLTGGLAAGDRLCDAPLVGATDGSRTTLFSAIRDTRHKLLLLPASSNDTPISHLTEIAGEVERNFPSLVSPHVILPGNAPARAISTHGLPTWIDAENQLYRKLHANAPTIVLVRPDGYLNYRCQPADGQKLMSFLGSYLIPKT